jgi:glycosyltransferase involved in cell wall biosynthesis
MSRNSRPLVTIGIPTYNRASLFLPSALACARGQTYTNIEIVVSDNCSTDNTEDVVKQCDDSRIRYFKQSHNIGANSNFNFALNQARGDFFLLLLDDDIIDPDFIETCVVAADGNTDIGIIRTGTRILDMNGNALFERPNTAAGLSLKDLFLAWFSNELTFYVCSTLFNTNYLRSMGGFGSRHNLFQDVMIEVKLAARYGRIDIRESKAGFRIHEENLGASSRVHDWCEDSLDLLNLLCQLAPDDAELLRREGKRFFCRMNCRLASRLNSLSERMKTYWMVTDMFDRAYSPLNCAYQQELLPFLRRLKARMKSSVAGIGRNDLL